MTALLINEKELARRIKDRLGGIAVHNPYYFAPSQDTLRNVITDSLLEKIANDQWPPVVCGADAQFHRGV